MDDYRPPPCSVFFVRKKRVHRENSKERRDDTNKETIDGRKKKQNYTIVDEKKTWEEFQIEKDIWIRRWIDSLVNNDCFETIIAFENNSLNNSQDNGERE